VAIGRASGGTPDTPEFSAQPKMRPNEGLPESHIFVNSLLGEALYMLIWVDIFGVEALYRARGLATTVGREADN
jgi:hypothetical protein